MLPHITALRIEPLAPFFGVAIILTVCFGVILLQPESEQARLRRDGKGRVYGEAYVRHVWCDRSQAWRVVAYPSVPSLVCYCILASKLLPVCVRGAGAEFDRPSDWKVHREALRASRPNLAT